MFWIAGIYEEDPYDCCNDYAFFHKNFLKKLKKIND